jgi:hypothetical protein
MKVKVHWIMDGIAELDAESLEAAEQLVNAELARFVKENADIPSKLGINAIQGKAYLPGSAEDLAQKNGGSE